MLLAVGAHALGGGHLPSATQIAVLLGLALVVGLVRAGQVRGVERDRARGRLRIGWIGTVAALAAGQVAAHVVLSLIDGHAGHAGMSAAPGSAMLFWHAVAVPAAGAVLYFAERLSRLCRGGLDRCHRLLTAPRPFADGLLVRPSTGFGALLRPQPMVAAAGVRGPPRMI